MHPDALRKLLDRLANGEVSVDDAVARLRSLPFEDIGFARLDHHRPLRCGFPEVVFGQGKTDDQVVDIFARLAAGGGNVLATRVSPCAGERIVTSVQDACYNSLARAAFVHRAPETPAAGLVAIVAAGTADLPVAEEARITAELMNQPVKTLYDVGVAGLHRLLAESETLREANVLVVVAGMEGALPSVVGGLVAAPVIAVPTSVGYGASLGGLAALLAMLNSCAAGVSVVNIDNGFGAGYQAALINRLASAPPGPGCPQKGATNEH